MYLPSTSATVAAKEAGARPAPLRSPQAPSTALRSSLTNFASLARFYTDHHGADNEERYTVFHSAAEPGISLPDYALRMNRHLDTGDDAVLLSLILIGRYSQRTGFLPSVLTVHRLFLASLRVVTKAQHDVTRSTASYARAGGIHVAELCRLERHLLDGVAFSVFFTQADLDHFNVRFAMAHSAPSASAEALTHIAFGLGLPPPPVIDRALAERLDSPDQRLGLVSIEALQPLTFPLDGSLTVSHLQRPELMSASDSSVLIASARTPLQRPHPPGLRATEDLLPDNMDAMLDPAEQLNESHTPPQRRQLAPSNAAGGSGHAAVRTLRAGSAMDPEADLATFGS